MSDLIVRGWLRNARRLVSPNQDERPAGCRPDLLVIHNISLPPGEFGGCFIDDFFCNRLDPDGHPFFRQIAEVRVSAHLLIRRDGEIIQYVALDKRAWHAGQSSFEGRPACNDYSIGIELEGTDTVPFEDVQYLALVNTTRLIMQKFPLITPERITGHSDIAPDRKTDPGPWFDWNRYRAALSQKS